jgi:hypothetical protein
MKPGMTTQGRFLSRVSVMAGFVPAIYVLRTAHAKKTWMPGIKRGMTTQADCALRRQQPALRFAINPDSHFTAKHHRPYFFGAGYAVVTSVPSKRRGRWRARWRNHYSFSAALPLENAGASWRAIAGVFLTAPAALCGCRPLSPPCSPLWRSLRRAVRPRWPCSWRAARSGRRAEPRRRPSAGGASSPGRGRRIRSHPHDAS